MKILLILLAMCCQDSGALQKEVCWDCQVREVLELPRPLHEKGEKTEMDEKATVTPLTDRASLQLAEEVHERLRALHARLSRYENLIDEKDARIAELEKQLTPKEI